MAANTTAPAAEFVIVGQYGEKAPYEVTRYAKRASAATRVSRLRRVSDETSPVFRVVSAEEWATEQAARHLADAEAVTAEAAASLAADAHLASEGFVPAEGVEAPEGDDDECVACGGSLCTADHCVEADAEAERDGADLAAAEVVEEAEEAAAEAAPARKLTLAERRALAGPVHDAMRRVLAELDLTAPGLENVTARDAEACVALWAWYLPNGKQWDGQL